MITTFPDNLLEVTNPRRFLNHNFNSHPFKTETLNSYNFTTSSWHSVIWERIPIGMQHVPKFFSGGFENGRLVPSINSPAGKTSEKSISASTYLGFGKEGKTS